MKKWSLLLFALTCFTANAEDVIRLDSTEVSSKGFYRPSLKENNGKVVITETEIQKKDYPSVASIFEDSPLTVVHNTPFGPVVDLRGSGERTISRVKVMLNGVSINPLEEAMGSIPFDAIPIDAIGKIEISPGTGTTLHGGGTTGGTINIITKSGKQNDYITINAGASSYSTWNIGGAEGFNVTKDLFVNIGEYYRHGKGYREGDKSERTNFLGGFDWRITPKQKLAFQANLYRENMDGSTELEKTILSQNRRAMGEKTKSEVDRSGYSLDYDVTPNDNFKFKFNINGAEFDRDVFQHGKQALIVNPDGDRSKYPFIGDKIKDSDVEMRSAFKDIETDLKGEFDEKVRAGKFESEINYNNKKGKLTFGYEYKKHTLKREADMQQLPTSIYNDGAVFLKDYELANKDIYPVSYQDKLIGKSYTYFNLIDGKAALVVYPRLYEEYKARKGVLPDEAKKEELFKQANDNVRSDFQRILGDAKQNARILAGSDVFKKTHSLFALNEYQFTDKFKLKTGARWEHSKYGGTRHNDVFLQFSNLENAPFTADMIAFFMYMTPEEERELKRGTLKSVENSTSYEVMNTKETSDDFGGEVGFTYEYSPTGNVYFRYERGFVSPTPSQLTNKDFLTGAYYPSNIKSEKVDTFEIGSKRFLGRNSYVAATLFYSMTHNEITLIDYNGSNPMNRRWAYTNLMETNRYGLELQAQHWIGQFKLRESLTYTSAKIGKDSAYKDFIDSYGASQKKSFVSNRKIQVPYKKGDKVPMVSDLKLTLGLDYQWNEKLMTGASYTYVSGYEIRSPQENFDMKTEKVKGHGVVDVYGRYNITENASVRFGINNVLDQKYNLREDGKFAVPAPTRNYYAGFSYRF